MVLPELSALWIFLVGVYVGGAIATQTILWPMFAVAILGFAALAAAAEATT